MKPSFSSTSRKRSLILAGGGLKVGYQAGCLQVLLDEAGLEFDHVDGASGGCFNAAMLCSGMSGTQIADNWRKLNPFDMVSFNTREYHRLLWARSIATLDKLVQEVFPKWKLDFDAIRASKKPTGTFNVYNFSKKRVEIIDNASLSQQYLLAAVALPMWFPPVNHQGDILFDAVYCTDGNVGEAVRRGADEMWSIWTVADQGEYRDGFLAQYFHVIETVANTRFFREWEEIDTVNRAIEKHGADTSRATPDLQLREGYDPKDPELRPPPGRKRIEQHLIKQEVPIHYLLNLSQDRMAETVEMGVRDARDYCRKLGLLKSAPTLVLPAAPVNEPPIGLEFSERMTGHFTPGSSEPLSGEQEGKQAGNTLTLDLSIHIEDLDAFLRLPEHEARITGSVESPVFGGQVPVISGAFNLFVIEDRGTTDNPQNKQMRYTVRFKSREGHPYLLEGIKQVRNDPGIDLWTDLTKLFVRIHRDTPRPELFGAGIVHIHPAAFAKQLTTFRVRRAPTPLVATRSLARFGQFFAGRVWDVYARGVLDYAPL